MNQYFSSSFSPSSPQSSNSSLSSIFIFSFSGNFKITSRGVVPIKNEEFLEYAKVFNHLYGTTTTPVIEKLEKGENVIFDIDWQGADQIKNKRLNYKLITFFVLPPSRQVLFNRLSNRDMKDKLIVEERMKDFSRDVLHWINYDYVVINDNLDECYLKVSNLIDAEINNGSKDYDKNFIIKHVGILTS